MQPAGRLLPLVVLLAWIFPINSFAQLPGETYMVPNTPMMVPGPVLPYADTGTGLGMGTGCNACAQRRGPVRNMLHNRLCTRCQKRGCCGECQSAPVVSPCPACTTAPVMQPSLVPSLTYRDVPQTLTRREAYAVQVPVTTYKTVAVTGYQQQIKYRDVPYTVMQKVPQVQYTPIYNTAAVSTGCNTCNAGLFNSPAYTTTMMFDQNAMVAPDYSTAQSIQPYPYAPQQALVPQYPHSHVDKIPEIGNLNVPVPTADPHVVTPRTSALDQEGWQVIKKSGSVQQTATNYDGDIKSSVTGKFTGVKSSSSVQARSSTDAVIR